MKKSIVINLVLIGALLVVLNSLSAYLYTYFDLTEDKRYTLTKPTIEVLEGLEDVHYFQFFLEGTFPAGIKRYRDRVEEILKEFQKHSPYIEYEFLDPLEGSNEDIQKQQKLLLEMGMHPASVNYYEGEQSITKPMYPYALLNGFNRKVKIDLLNVVGLVNYDDETLNAQESQLEYKIINAIKKVSTKEKPLIVFTEGNGELEDKQTASLKKELRQYYNVGRVNLDTAYTLANVVDLLVVAGPNKPISDRNQFIIDQYIMQGGKVIWMVESLDIRLDSISKYGKFLPPQIETGLDGLFFKYGFRIQDNVIADLECTRIPLQTSFVAGKPQYSLFKYYYHLLLSPAGKHPIVKNIDRVNMTFPSTIDTVNQQNGVKKTVLVNSSRYSRYQLYPVTLNFEIFKQEPQVNLFNKGFQTVGLLLEGTFESAYKNRLSAEQMASLEKLGTSFKESSSETAMIVFSDKDFIKNKVDPNSNRITPLGYNKWEKNVFNGNKDLIINSIEYLLDDAGILASRSKEYKLRMLDANEVRNRAGYWKSLNVAFPLVLLALFGLIYNFIRKRRYTKN